jgi:hypothetical protein
MSNSSILGGERAASRARGRDADSLGPSDSSDSGSDVQGERATAVDAENTGEFGALPVSRSGDSDAAGTGERGSATGRDSEDAADILPDRIATDPMFATDVENQANDLLDADVDIEDIAVDDDLEADGDDEDAESETRADSA